MDETTAYVALGANLGDAAATLRQAMADLACVPECRLLRQSSLYRTAPVDSTGPDYINAVVALATRLQPLALLHVLQALEQGAGRQRPFHNAPRTLDLDLLTYGSVAMDHAELRLPHPRMNDRAFVLVPLAEIAPETVSAAQLRAVQDQAIFRLQAS